MNNKKKMKTYETGSFGTMNDFAAKVKEITPEYYQEVNRIVDKCLYDFLVNFGRKPSLLDIGGAGVLPFDFQIPDKICIMDIFQKPDQMMLPDNVEWVVQNILSEDIPYKEKYDFVILSGVLHHLADKHNNIIPHLKMCLGNATKLLTGGGCCLIFESICPPHFNKIQDALYPLYSIILTKVLQFPYARFLTLREITTALNAMKLNYSMIDFKKIKQHYLVGYQVSSKICAVINYVCFQIMR